MPIDDKDCDQKDWQDALPLNELPLGTTAETIVGDEIIALANIEGAIHAFDGICSHQGGPLAKGKLAGCTLTCPWHGWQYDVTTGKQILSKTIQQRVYAVRVVDDMIQVRPTP